MRYFVVLIFMLISQSGMAQEWEERSVFNEAGRSFKLRIISSTDTAIFAPIISKFVTENTDIAIEYMVTGTADVDRKIRANPDAFDVVISSAMDLQLKLANDGFARQLVDISHPSWAQWRQSLFAFTSEPAAIVINKAAFGAYPIPQTRQDLIEAMRARPEIFAGRVGTYDIRRSGLGYLFATQDSRASETYWRLMEVMGALDVRLYCCSGEMIDDLADGTIVVAYNVLGSYVAARPESKETLAIVLPADFPTTMMRTAMVSKDTKQPDIAKAFVRHLITQQIGVENDNLVLPPLTTHVSGAERSTIALEPALMTFLDSLKRSKFFAEWEDAVIQK